MKSWIKSTKNAISSGLNAWRERGRERRGAKWTERVLSNWRESTDSSVTWLFLQRRNANDFHAKLYFLAGQALARAGISSYYLFHDETLPDRGPRLEIDHFRIDRSLIEEEPRVLYRSTNEIPVTQNVTVDLDNKRVEVSGINFFNELQSSLRRLRKCYNLDFGEKELVQDVEKAATTCLLVEYYFALIRRKAIELNQRFLIAGWESSYLPASIFARLCEDDRDSNLVQFVDFNRGYIHYFGKYGQDASYVAFNNTTRKKVKDRLVVTRDELDAALSSVPFNKLREPIEGALAKKVSDPSLAKERSEISRLIDRFRSKGHRVYVLIAHLFYDVAVPDRSDAFADMSDWISATCRWFMGRNDLLLLKPHPAELAKGSPHNLPAETLSSLCEEFLAEDNIQILDPALYSIRGLADRLSGGLIWRSSVALELTYLGIPNVVVGDPPYEALGFQKPTSPDHYFQMVSEINDQSPTESQKWESAAYLYAMREKHFACRAIENRHWDPFYLRKTLRGRDRDFANLVDQLVRETNTVDAL